MSFHCKIERGAVGDIRSIYNSLIATDGLCYRPLTEEEFQKIFNMEGTLTLTMVGSKVADQDQSQADQALEPLGFLSARLPNEEGVSFLTFVGVLKEHQGHGLASELLDRAEKILKNEYNAKRIDIVFRNPAQLPWIIPGSTDGHPCAPGIATDSPAAKLLQKRGYTEWCAQLAYYMPLSIYSDPAKLEAKRQALAEDGIVITYYDEKKHHGFYELFDAIRNPGWRKTVMAHLDQPIIVAVDEKKDGLVIGYTGPLAQVKEGNGIRGSFCGIGTHPDYRGRGIATQIFCGMCRHHSENGATFMSLYTGETNPARHVYEAAGCRVAVRWANLRLVLQPEENK